jgi:hypothetical protein
MMSHPLRFCQFTDNELNALSQELSIAFNFEPSALALQYDRWRSNFESGEAVEDIRFTYISKDSTFQSFVESSHVVGADLPTILQQGEDALTYPTVMFVAQDPRRDPVRARSERITLGTPFALHCPWGRYIGPTTRLVFQAAQFWLEKNWRVYLTDVIKLYAFDDTHNKARNLPKPDYQRFEKMLAAEIQLFQPKVIVTIGAVAHRAVQQLSPNASVIAVPHFSGANQSAWKKLLGGEQRITNEAKLAWYVKEIEKLNESWF